MTCCIYARVSFPPKRKKGALDARVLMSEEAQMKNCHLQLTELREWAARHEWIIIEEYVETIRGARTDRPQLARLMKDAEAKRFDCVLVYKLDRFGRSMLHLTQLLKDLERWGIRFLATSQGIDTDKASPTSRLLVHILSAVAEFERSLIQERTVLGVQNALIEGPGSLRPNGTARGKVGKPPAVFDRTHALELRETGMSWRAVAGELKIPYSTLRQNMPAEAAVIANGGDA